MKFSKEKIIILLTVFIDVIGVGIVIPVMPYYVQSVGATAITITTLFAVFSLCSFFSAPFLGAWSDKIGRRPALIISIASSALGWFVFASAQSIIFLFVGRIIDGMAAGNFSIAQSYMADLSKDDKERTANMGLIGAIFGIGFIIGPVIGSLLSQISIATPFWFVGGLASANMVAAYLFLPETNLNLVKNRKISINPFSPIAKAIRDNVLRTRYAVLFLFGLAISVQQSIFALYTQSAFGFGVQSTGYLMTLMGAIMVVNQGFLLKNFWLKKFKESQLEIWLLLVFAIAFFVMSAANLIVFIIGLVAMIFMQSVLRAVMSSRITGLSDPTKKGEVAGIMASLMTASMVIGPLSVGAIFAFNQHLPFVASGIILLIAFFIMYAGRGLVDEEKCRHEEVEPVEVL